MKLFLVRLILCPVACLVSCLVGCSSGDGGSADSDASPPGGAGGGSGGEPGPLPDVPYSGSVTPLPEGSVVDAESYLPLMHGGIWRYRKKAADFTMPGPVEQGAEATVTVGPHPMEADWLEALRTQIAVFDIAGEGDVPKKIIQTLTETYVIEPPVGQVGPKISFARMDIEEREVETQRFVRTLVRDYDPPYTIIEDAWRVGTIFSEIMEHPRITETTQILGMEAPEEESYVGDVRVSHGQREETLPMEGRYREKVRQVDVYDDLSQQITRTMWLQPGVGIVQFVHTETKKMTFTLTETNVETP